MIVIPYNHKVKEAENQFIRKIQLIFLISSLPDFS